MAMAPANAHAQAKRALALLVSTTVLCALIIDAHSAQAGGAAKYDFRMFPRVGTPTTTFRVTFTAPFAAGEGSDYTLEAVGPRRCPNIYDYTVRSIRRGERVVMRLRPVDDLYFNERRTWCRGSYVGYVYYSQPDPDEPDTLIGYFRFGVGRAPVSLEG